MSCTGGREGGRVLVSRYPMCRCSGSEKTLAECTRKVMGVRAEECGHRGDAGVECNAPVTCPVDPATKVRADRYRTQQ